MGWDFTQGASCKDVIRRQTRRQENDKYIWETLDHKLVNIRHLWTISRRTDKATGAVQTVILLFLLGKDGNYGWGYKDMTESMGPAYYDCPLAFLDAVPEPQSEYSAGWRDKVRAYHESMRRRFSVGQVVHLLNCRIPSLTLTSIKPLRGTYGGITYRVPKRLVA